MVVVQYDVLKIQYIVNFLVTIVNTDFNLR